MRNFKGFGGMMQNINDIAIALTKKIENDLVREFFKGDCVRILSDDPSSIAIERTGRQPTFYYIRQTILETLLANMDELRFSYHIDREAPKGSDYEDHLIKRAARGVVEEIINSNDHFDINDYGDKYLGANHGTIVVIKSGKIRRDLAKNGF